VNLDVTSMGAWSDENVYVAYAVRPRPFFPPHAGRALPSPIMTVHPLLSPTSY
jgi:hypothetical protein